jgi:hypothetical protein
MEKCSRCNLAIDLLFFGVKYKVGDDLVLCESCFYAWKKEQLNSLQPSEPDKSDKPMCCPKCFKEYDSTWKVCAGCSVKLVDKV